MSQNEQMNDKIQKLLSNPESLKSILEIASSLGAKTDNSENAPLEEKNTESAPAISQKNDAAVPALPFFGSGGGGYRDDRVNLLLSIKPFLSDHKRQRVDGLVKALNAAKIINAYKDTDLFSTFGFK